MIVLDDPKLMTGSVAREGPGMCRAIWRMGDRVWWGELAGRKGREVVLWARSSDVMRKEGERVCCGIPFPLACHYYRLSGHCQSPQLNDWNTNLRVLIFLPPLSPNECGRLTVCPKTVFLSIFGTKSRACKRWDDDFYWDRAWLMAIDVSVFKDTRVNSCSTVTPHPLCPGPLYRLHQHFHRFQTVSAQK